MWLSDRARAGAVRMRDFVAGAATVYIGVSGPAASRRKILERPVFDLSLTKILVLAVLALIIFGPDQLPKIAGQAGRALRDLRRIAENAKSDLQEGLGPEFRDFDINDLNPRHLVRKHLWDDVDGGGNGNGNGNVTAARYSDARAETAGAAGLMPGESPPYDSEAT
jgi:sec-independent protein translocase protein TatB